MKQQSQTNLALGIGAITIAVVAGYFGIDYLSGKKSASGSAPASDYSAVIDKATGNLGSGTVLTADDAKRIGEEVAREVATRVAQAIVDQKGGATGGGGLTEADARRIGEEEGRRVAQEVATATVQQAMAAGSGSSKSASLTAAEAEQIGDAAGRRAALDVVRNDQGGTAGQAVEGSSSVEVTQKAGTGADALHAWWATPASGDFGLMYAGQPKGEAAIALLFSDQPSEGAVSQNVKVYDAKGALVGGNWEAATNPRLAILRGLQPGRYTVVVESALAGAAGKSVSKAQHGPVYVI